MVKETTLIKLDRDTDSRLEALAEHESRSKVDEVRFLIKERAKALGVKLK